MTGNDSRRWNNRCRSGMRLANDQMTMSLVRTHFMTHSTKQTGFDDGMDMDMTCNDMQVDLEFTDIATIGAYVFANILATDPLMLDMKRAPVLMHLQKLCFNQSIVFTSLNQSRSKTII